MYYNMIILPIVKKINKCGRREELQIINVDNLSSRRQGTAPQSLSWPQHNSFLPFFFWPHYNFSSLTRDRTHAPYIGNTESLPSDPQGSRWKGQEKEQLRSGEACPVPPQARWSRVMPTVGKVDGMCSWQGVTSMSPCLCHRPPKNGVAQSNLESSIRQTQTEGHFTKHLTSSHNCQGAQNKSSLRNPQPRGVQKDMAHTCNVGGRSPG